MVKPASRNNIDWPAEDALQFVRDSGKTEQSRSLAIGRIDDNINVALLARLIARDRPVQVQMGDAELRKLVAMLA